MYLVIGCALVAASRIIANQIINPDLVWIVGAIGGSMASLFVRLHEDYKQRGG